MSKAASSQRCDHGAALRVPSAHNRAGWRSLEWWLGEAGRAGPRTGTIEVCTPEGWIIASPGDWIVLSAAGAYHVAGR